ncbi:BatD family protein [Methylacidimicrobium sp. B4]|uniref:BatD family protein n=1 Tax=Methylacidimicrobium sp. B4 TaxID=2796139 RepID=UPI001A8F4EB0|nr:BatD family protein [Methylacidimicrobium sp. B4]QSR84062.1 BatD family protein [Methylacidimicrobium sp. B4]
MKRLLAFPLLGAILSSSLLHAQSAHWSPPESRAALDSSCRLELFIEGGVPPTDPELPVVPYLEVSAPKRERSIGLEQGKESSVAYAYTVHPLRAGPYTVPAFPLVTDRGVVSVPPLTFWVGEPSLAPSFASSAEASLTLFRNEVWQGEPFPVEYRLLAHAGAFLEITGQPEWTPPDLLVDRWSRPERVSGESRGAFFSGLRYSALAIALSPGKISLPPVSQPVTMEAGKFGQGLFSQAIIRPLILRSAPFSLQVKPLPSPPGEGFSQAVGTFRLTSQISPSDVQVGEPATWMLRIEGMGNWTSPWKLTPPVVPSGLRVIEPAPRRQNDPDSLFCASLVMERILVADRPGRYAILPYRFTYFDPLAGIYRTALAPSAVLTVTPGSSASAGYPPDRSSLSREEIPKAEEPGKNRRPRAPLSGFARGLAPMENGWLLGEAGGLGAVILALWLSLARRHARLADPLQRRRAGLRRLRRIHREMGRAVAPAERQKQLFRWQSAIRDAWLVVPAAPELAELQAALERAQVDPVIRTAWMRLWQEAEVHLYAREASLPPDWIERSQERVRELRIPRSSWKTTFALRHLFPLLTISGLFLFSAWGTSGAAPEGSGRWAHSGGLQDLSLQNRPTDWIARSNAGAVLAGEGRWAEALAQWSAAFLLAPRDSAVRWNFSLALSRCPGVDERLSALANGPLWIRWISIGSPAEWQILLAAALAALFLGGVLLLLARYGLIPPALPLQRALLACGLALSGMAAIAVALYGPMADPCAGLVTEEAPLRSVPTEAQPQIRAVVSPALVVIGKPFLHWVQVRLASSHSGWMRAEAVVPFFQPPLEAPISPGARSEKTVLRSPPPPVEALEGTVDQSCSSRRPMTFLASSASTAKDRAPSASME